MYSVMLKLFVCSAPSEFRFKPNRGQYNSGLRVRLAPLSDQIQSYQWSAASHMLQHVRPEIRPTS